MRHLVSLALLFSTVTAFANTEGKPNFSYSMAGLEVGFKWSSADVTGSTSNKQVIGYQIGGTATFDLAPGFAIKSGLLYNQRPFESEFGAVKTTGKVTYFDVPLLAMFKFEDYAGVYLGTALSTKLSDETSAAGGLQKVKGMVTPLIVGGQFKFAPNMGVNIYFESVSGEIATGVENARAVGANLLVTFD